MKTLEQASDTSRPTAAKNLASVPAIILAGGLGTRLRPVVTDRPKVLAEVRGRPFLTYLLDQLVEAGVTSVTLCTGYKGEQVAATFGDAYGPLQLVYSQELSPLGTAGALRLALPLLAPGGRYRGEPEEVETPASDSVLVLNGDSFCEADLTGFWSWHCTRQAGATLLLAEVLDTGRYGRVQLHADGRIASFKEKDLKSEPGWINAGIYLLTRSLLSTIPPHNAVSLEKEIFPAWIGHGLYGYQNRGAFLDIGTPQSYADASAFFEARALAPGF